MREIPTHMGGPRGRSGEGKRAHPAPLRFLHSLFFPAHTLTSFLFFFFFFFLFLTNFFLKCMCNGGGGCTWHSRVIFMGAADRAPQSVGENIWRHYCWYYICWLLTLLLLHLQLLYSPLPLIALYILDVEPFLCSYFPGKYEKKNGLVLNGYEMYALKGHYAVL